MSRINALCCVVAATSVALVSMVGGARASLVTSPAFPDPVQVVDFNTFGPGFATISGTVQIGSPTVGGIALTATGESRVIGTGNFGLGDNGLWDTTHSPYVAAGGSTFSGGGSLTFSFNSGDVRAVGGLMNYGINALPPLTMTAFDRNGFVLESYDLTIAAPIFTPGSLNVGLFRGIVRPQADIAAFQVSAAGVVFDDLTFTSQTRVPETETAVLLVLGLIGASVAVYRRRVADV